MQHSTLPALQPLQPSKPLLPAFQPLKASGRCLPHGFGCQKHMVKANGRCLHHGFGAKQHGGKPPLPAPWFGCQKHGEGKRPLPSPWLRQEALILWWLSAEENLFLVCPQAIWITKLAPRGAFVARCQLKKLLFVCPQPFGSQSLPRGAFVFSFVLPRTCPNCPTNGVRVTVEADY